MSSHNSGFVALITGGLGAAIVGLAGAAMQLVAKRGEARAAAADLIARAAGGMVDRLEHENVELRERLAELEEEEKRSAKD